MNDDKVIVDFFEYEPDENGDPYPETVEQIEKMSKMLCHGKGLGFHILPGVGFIHESHTNRFGVVFRLGSEQAKTQSPPVTLQSLYKKYPYLSLSHRVIIACAIATAIENLHRVEWIHKEIRSDNICFFIPADDEHNDTNIPSPWLFGFEYARAMASGTRLEEDHSEVRNLYRHPQRWSKPQEKFTRAHDIYALGVVLLEIADWNEVGAIVTAAKDRCNPHKCRARLEYKLRKHAKHKIGNVFAHAIAACFEYETKLDSLSVYEMQLLIQKSIVDPLQAIAGKI